MTRSGRWPGAGESNYVGLRITILCVLVAVWGWRTMVNAELRRRDEEAAMRTQTLKEIRLARVAVIESQAFLPEPGTGDPSWWTDRLDREAKKAGLAVARSESKATDFAIGTFRLDRRELVVVGAYDGVVRFTGWLESSQPRVRIQDFELAPEDAGQVRASLVLYLPVPGDAK